MEKVYAPLCKVINYAMDDLKPFPGLQLRYIINLQKGGTAPFIVLLMLYYQNFGQASWVYLGLHGSYGIIWLIKDMAFPDKNFVRPVSLLAAALVAAVLMLYMVFPCLVVSGYSMQTLSAQRIALCISLLSLGLGIVLSSDAQKYFTLKYKQGLISDGMFAYTRSPNYFGELLIYLSFAICIGHWAAYGILLLVWLTLFGTLMVNKDISFKKKKGWEEYSKTSWMLFPKIIPSSSTMSFGIYALIFSVIILNI